VFPLSEDSFLSENPKAREHIHSIFLNAVHYVGISKLMAKLESSKSAAVLYALNEGLHGLEVISKEDYELLAKRYGRKLKDVIEQSQTKREPSHVPILTIEQRKEKQLLEQKDKQFKGMLEQWPTHSDPNWRIRVFAEAEKWKDKLESSRLLLAKKESAVSHE
jgi:hypothetical protein